MSEVSNSPPSTTNLPIIGFRVSHATKKRYTEKVAWGLRQPLMEQLTLMLLDFLDTDNGKMFIGMVASGEVSFDDFIRATAKIRETNPSGKRDD